MKTLDCLIIRQPFASLIVFGVKRWEFRSYSCDKKGTIAIAASRNTPLLTSNAKLNEAAAAFPRGVVLGTAEIVKSYPITVEALKNKFKCCQQVNIHGLRFEVACEPIGEPPMDVNMALNRQDWKKFVWELKNVRPVKSPFRYVPAHGSTWTKASLNDDSNLMSFIC